LAIPGGRITLEGEGFRVDDTAVSTVTMGGARARVVIASPRRLVFVVPDGVEGPAAVRVDEAPGESVLVEIGRPVVTGLHQVDNPVIDRAGTIYVTFSGARGEESPVSVFRVRPDGVREPFVTGVTNPTALAFDPNGRLYVSSRFDGRVYRVDDEGQATVAAADLGVACGLAFAEDGSLFVGDRSGTIHRVTPSGEVVPFATLPPSVAAFHLAFGPDGHLFVTAPTLSTRDVVYRISPHGTVDHLPPSFGRPQGLAFGPDGHLYVVEAMAGASGVYRLRDGAAPAELVAAGPDLIGLAFDPLGGWVVSSASTLFRFASLPDGL
jgi:sugar lactone lactonase YvrE